MIATVIDHHHCIRVLVQRNDDCFNHHQSVRLSIDQIITRLRTTSIIISRWNRDRPFPSNGLAALRTVE